MVRWKPGSKERLQVAALELFAARGFEQTTAAEIAGAVGLTERTFFRYFSDKREVLFEGQESFMQTFVDGVNETPPDAAPLDFVANALGRAAELFPNERRGQSRTRQSVIDSHPALQERETHKMSNLAATIAGALHDRGIREPAASLAAESCVTVLTIAFAHWLRDGESRSMRDIFTEVLGELRNLSAGASSGTSSGASS